MNNNFIKNINQIIDILSKDQGLNFNHPQLPKFTQKGIATPIGNFTQTLTLQKSVLPNYLVDLTRLKKLIKQLNEKQAMIRLSHIGFGYKVNDLNQEKVRLVELSKKAHIPLFQEPSNDNGLWLFLGDVSDWQNPVTEFVPVAQTSDKNAKYWLPHIQIDIDTSLDDQDIISLVKNAFDQTVSPFPIRIDGITYIVRNRLGCIDGINIFLDLATNKRNVPFLRQKIWKRIA